MITKFITLGIISAMSFLGYSLNDYANYLPTPIKIILEQDISPVTDSQATTSKQIVQTQITQVNIQPQPKQKNQKKKTATSTTTSVKITPEKTNPTIPNIPTVPAILPTITIPATTTTQVAPFQQYTSAQTSSNLLSLNAPASQKIADSVVNIYCQAIRGSYIETVTGSAVEIDPSGVYLTNAHVAIYVMLSDTQPAGNISCYIREGGPAKKIYEAKSVYVPSAWVYSHKNAYTLGVELTGTGEKDYALIKRGASNPALGQNNFPTEWAAQLVSNLPTKGQNIILSGYPVFDKSVITSALFQMTNNSSILNIFNLNGEANALFDSDSTKLAQIGSSGGGAFNTDGNLFGIMDASINNTPGELPSERIIGINYIKDDILRDTGKSFESFITNANSESENFIKNSAPALSQVLTSNSSSH